MREIMMWEALNEALREEMKRDAKVFCLGEDIGRSGGEGPVERAESKGGQGNQDQSRRLPRAWQDTTGQQSGHCGHGQQRQQFAHGQLGQVMSNIGHGNPQNRLACGRVATDVRAGTGWLRVHPTGGRLRRSPRWRCWPG